MKLIVRLLTVALLASACGDGDMGTSGVPAQHAALKDQGIPFSSEAAAAGGDASRRATFSSTPAPSPADACMSSCAGACGDTCNVLCLICPSSDLARCLSTGGGPRNEGEGGAEECSAKLQLCLSTHGCPLQTLDPPQDEDEEEFEF